MALKLLRIILFQLSLMLSVKCESDRHEWGIVSSGEYCDYQTFKPQCNQGYTLQILSADYGHISIGKCVKVDLNVFGCQTDVKYLLSPMCDGKPSCQLMVNDMALRNLQPCEVGITVFLEVTYGCVSESAAYKTCSSLRASPFLQFISSQQLYSTTCPSSHIPKFQAEEGQQINFTLIDLRPEDQRQQAVSAGIIVDDKTQDQFTLNLNGQSEQVIGASSSNLASLVLNHDVQNSVPFIIGYKVFGCADIHGPPGTTVEREKNVVTIKCIQTAQKWSLTCRGVQWVGVYGACDEVAPPVTKRIITDAPPKEHDDKLLVERDVVYLIVICATIFLSVLVVTTGYVCLKKAQIARGLAKPKPPPEAEWAFGANQGMTLLAKTRPDSDYLHPAAYQTDDVQPPPPTSLYDTPLPNPPTIKRNNDEDYNATVSSTSTDYKKYFVLDKDYMNTKEFLNNV